ncbi:hypothetical protein RN001_009439 [Aquatica leii]|uniref:Sarcospan n=1 Tax=Aquatica leii TaxID=1421715 RepID=A0AAN7QG99_9COLE|nr:hypothetical protein RN001_009439 [Aquatica leii]
MTGRGRSVTLPRMGVTVTENQSNGNHAGISNRPISYYDNIRENGQRAEHSSLEQNEYELRDLRFERARSPTQVHLLNTTVPQNIGIRSLSERHEPTRNSLRHSRMIVMSRSGKVPKKCLPLVLIHHKLAKGLTGLQILLGFALASLSLWLLLWAPNIRQRDNPYWSGISLLLSGICGLILLGCCKVDSPRTPKGYFLYSFKILSIFLSVTAGATCLTACIFAVIHLISLSTMTCAPLNQLNATCFCKVGSINDTALPLPVKSYHYSDLSCPEVNNILSILVIFSSGTNGIGGVISIWYVYLHWISRYSYNYSKVRIEENRPKPVLISST